MKERLAYQAQVVSSTSHDYEVVEFIKLPGLVVDVASASATACFVREFVHLWTQQMFQEGYIRLVIAGTFVVLFSVRPQITGANTCCVAVANGCPCADEGEVCDGEMSFGGIIFRRSINVRSASDKNHQQEYEPNHPRTGCL